MTDTKRSAPESFTLTLYVCGATPHCMSAIKNIKDICQQYLKGRCELDIVDISQHPEVALDAQIIAAPTLIKLQPTPERRLIGDLSDTHKVLTTLGIQDNHGS